ncbi:MAG: flagellar basal body rod protein FlgC, partial [Planctomycetales bacterium]|nr:flagellar basal body rod protein FlgC [Planctomycetales bacterium]
MEVVANNIANAHSTRTPEGGPYRRQEVVFAAAYQNAMGMARPTDIGQLGGVQIVGIQPDMTELPRVYQPGHPDADADDMVTLPNVSMPNEMVDLITASRGYEANLRALRMYRQMAEQALSILRGVG